MLKWLKNTPIKGKTIAVFAVLADKNPITWVNEFSDTIEAWCISEVQSERTMITNDLLNVLADSSQLITSFSSVSKALAGAEIMANGQDRIIVFGSFYTVSEVMPKALMKCE